MKGVYRKAPGALLDYTWDWNDWLLSEETIQAVSIVMPEGLTLDHVTNNTTTVTAWFTGGTLDQDYLVTCKVETNQGRKEERTMKILVRVR